MFNENHYSDTTLDKIHCANQTVKNKEFEHCVFKGCDWSYGNFSHNRFIDCVFEGCNLSMVKLRNSNLVNATFKDCKLLGINFSECEDFLFGVQFTNCVLDMASFMNRKMPKTSFIGCTLKEANFSNAQLSGAIFDTCDLMGALFNGTNLSSANLVTSQHFDIDPELNTIKKAKFTLYGLQGLLMKHEIVIE